MSPRLPNKIQKLLNMKKSGEKITMLTAYDFPVAALMDAAGIDVVLVGDSLANVVLGLDSTTQVGMEEMLHHTKAVRRAVKNAVLLGDMPFSSYQTKSQDAVKNAKRFIDEAGCDAVKIEWFKDCQAVAKKIVAAGIPVMGHVGLTPQTADKLGGFKVQGKDVPTARRIMDEAEVLANAGCFAIVLECIPDVVASEITQMLEVPTIGIGAGVDCDGQVLVSHDMLGMVSRFHPKFAKQYVDVTTLIKKGVAEFQKEVKTKKFPGKEHSFTMPAEELRKFREFMEE